MPPHVDRLPSESVQAERAVPDEIFDLRRYRSAAHFNVTHRRRQQFYALPSAHWQMLAEPPFSLLQNLSDVDDAIDCNSDIAAAILKHSLQSFNLPEKPEIGHAQNWQGCAKAEDVEKAHSTIRQFYRDWSVEGLQERRYCHGFVMDQLRGALGKRLEGPDKSSRPMILVPGAGLGRLVYEISKAGYDVEGNEISYHQLLASSWILNHAGATRYPLYPFATQFTNLHSRKQQLRKVMIPDVDPVQDLNLSSRGSRRVGELSMTAADFVVLYSTNTYEGSFDAVATVFFIDTAPNFVRYVDTVTNCLKVGGAWINVGPLLWHSDLDHHDKADRAEQGKGTGGWDKGSDAGTGQSGSFELTEEEVIWLLEKRGFVIEHLVARSEGVGYIQDPDSMFQNMYQVSSWVARKKG